MSVGTRVRHPLFGVGTVARIVGPNAMVAFDRSKYPQEGGSSLVPVHSLMVVK